MALINSLPLDDQPFRYISGSVHYFRISAGYWLDRLKKVSASGLNAIEFYVPWNFHEPAPGRLVFSGQANVTRFLDIADRLGLFVLLRLGPYICGEWENGGLPWWIFANDTGIRMRTSDKRFLHLVENWYSVLLPKIVPYLRKNGGPIIMLQMENEYGSFHACDRKYTEWLRDIFRHYFDNDTILYSTDGNRISLVDCGFVPGVYPTVDFGPSSNESIVESFSIQRHFAPHGPLVNSEFYPGWFVLWGQDHILKIPSIDSIISSSDAMFRMGASFNYYMYFV